jgi:hypothetical protein
MSLLRETFTKARKIDSVKLNRMERQILQNALDRTAVIEALVQLVMV